MAVVIFAVQESPGRISSGGLSKATTTLKSLASWLEMALWEAATPLERRDRGIADLGDVSLECFVRDSVDRDVARSDRG